MLDTELFEALIEAGSADITTKVQHNCCPTCNIPLDYTRDDEYICKVCGRIEDADTTLGQFEHRTGSKKYFSSTSDYSRIQRKGIIDQLETLNNKYTGTKITRDVFAAVAMMYGDVQRISSEDGARFVKRGNNKDEILAAILYYELKRVKIPRKRRDITLFMNLKSGGFSSGDDILRKMHSMGKLDIIVDDEIEPFIDRYLETLSINTPENAKFVADIVNRSEQLKLCMQSQLNSKIVGAIYLLVKHKAYDKSITDIEAATDNCKRTTFNKFAKAVEKYKTTHFADLF